MNLSSTRKQIINLSLFSILFVLLILTGCQNDFLKISSTPIPATDLPGASTQSIIEKEVPAEVVEDKDQISSMEAAVQEESGVTNTPQPTPAPTLSDWRDAPISPLAISDRVIEIYKEGQRQGRDPHSFSVIGDCQAIPFVFMGPYGRGEFEPTEAEGQLWRAITTFDTSFKRWSVTARGGFTAASILNPLQADPEQCKPGETPLSCEYRLNNPAYVFITLETWLDPETVDRYEIYLRQIIDAVIENGSVPILITKADSSELRGKEHVINPVIVRVAYENQLPLVNFWRSAQYLDNYGIDPDREGFHLSQAGYDLKNTLALRALYQAWISIDEGEIPVVVSPTQTAVPDENHELEVALAPFQCEDGCVFFGTAQSKDGNILGGGVYGYQPQSKSLTQILPSGFDLQDVSTDNQRLLVNEDNRLYEADLISGSTELVTETFNNDGRQGAYWNTDETEVIFLDRESPLLTKNGGAFNLIPAAKDERIIFESGICTSKDYCKLEGVFQYTINGDIEKLDTMLNPIFSPDGSRVAFLNPEAPTAENFFHSRYMVLEDTASGIASRRVLYFPEVSGFMVYADVETYTFSPESDKVFILYDVYSEYYEYSLRLETYLWDLNNGIRYDLAKLNGPSASLDPKAVWSPEGDIVLLFLTDINDEGEFSISIYQSDLLTESKLLLWDENIFTSPDYLYLTNIFWR